MNKTRYYQEVDLYKKLFLDTFEIIKNKKFDEITPSDFGVPEASKYTIELDSHIILVIAVARRYHIIQDYPQEFNLINQYLDYIKPIEEEKRRDREKEARITDKVRMLESFFNRFQKGLEESNNQFSEAFSYFRAHPSFRLSHRLSTINHFLLEVITTVEIRKRVKKEWLILADAVYNHIVTNTPNWETAHYFENPTRVVKTKNRKQEYLEYLQSDHWQETRKAALERAGHRCQVCATTSDLQVHHNSYENLGNEKPEDLVVLCRPHHKLFHGK